MAVSPDSIPRYAEPTWDELGGNEPKEHKCANCTHKVRILLDGKGYFLCVQERDDGEVGGEVYECDPEVNDCPDWDWDGYDQNNLWSEEEDNAIRVYYPTHGSKWEGWAEVLPNRTYRAISARACRIGVGRKWVYKRGKSKSRKKPVGDDRHYKTDFKPTPDPYERKILSWLEKGMTPTKIDASMHWYRGTTVRILTEMWERDDYYDTDTEGTTR